MSLARTSITAVRQIRATAALQQSRGLHLTGVNPNASRLLETERADHGLAHSSMTSKADQHAHSQITRHFNTTRSLKSVNDSSTIDFAYMPQFALESHSPPEILRIPLLPDNYNPPRRSAAHQEAVEEVIRPQISTASADGTYVVSAMSEVTDNHSIELDPFDLTKKVSMAAKKVVGDMKGGLKEEGIVRELWTSLLDDLLGPKKVSKA